MKPEILWIRIQTNQIFGQDLLQCSVYSETQFTRYFKLTLVNFSNVILNATVYNVHPILFYLVSVVM